MGKGKFVHNLRNLRLMRASWILFHGVIIAAFLLPDFGSCDLKLSKECGELSCKEHEYCREYDHTCNPCSSICTEGSNNFSKDTCEKECQDFIHDGRYVKSGNGEGSDQNIGALYQSLQKDILVLKVLVGVCLVVIAIILAAFIAFVVYFWRYIYPEPSKGGKASQKNNPSNPNKTLDLNEKKGTELATIYDNVYRHSPGTRRRDVSNDESNNSSRQQSPSKASATETLNTINSAKSSAHTVSTMVNGSSNNSLNALNRSNKKEPSQSTIPEYLTYDNASLAPSQGNGPIYTHHV